MDKKCTKCNIFKPLTDFSKRKEYKKETYKSWCKSCCNLKGKEYKLRNSDKVKERAKKNTEKKIRNTFKN